MKPHETERGCDRNSREAREELPEVGGEVRRERRELLAAAARIEHQRGVIERHVCDQQSPKRIDVALTRR
jgi:hypothetical protein